MSNDKMREAFEVGVSPWDRERLRNGRYKDVHVENDFLEFCRGYKAALTQQPESEPVAEALAQKFHEAYERLAPRFGYETREDTQVFDLDSCNGQLMVAVCKELLDAAPSMAEKREPIRCVDRLPVDGDEDPAGNIWGLSVNGEWSLWSADGIGSGFHDGFLTHWLPTGLRQPPLLDRAPVVEKREPDQPDLPLADGYALLPRELTAENGAKKLLLGEFEESITLPCPECETDPAYDKCEICHGVGEYQYPVPVQWDTIKRIWRKSVQFFEGGE